MEKEKVLSNLWSLRAGLSIISMQKDKTDKCSAIIVECEQRPSIVDKKLIEELSRKKDRYKSYQDEATHTFSFWGDILCPFLKSLAWLLLFLVFAIPALVGIGIFVWLWINVLSVENWTAPMWPPILLFIGGLVAIGISVAFYAIWAPEIWDNFTCLWEYDIKTPWKVKKDREFATESMLPEYEKEIAKLEEKIRRQEEGISSAKPTIKKKKEEISQLALTSTQLYKALKQQYGEFLDERDWQHLDLIIFYFETGRADSLKEALQLVDRQVQTDTIVNAIYNACAEICNTIKINTDRLGTLMAQGMLALSSQISDLKATQASQMQALLDSQTMLVALQKKSNQNSMQLMEDCRYLTTLAEQGEVRRRNNA